MSPQDPCPSASLADSAPPASPLDGPRKPARPLPFWLTVSLSVLCVLILLVTSSTTSHGPTGADPYASSNLSTDLSNPAPAPEYPYVVTPSQYPLPANVTPFTAPTDVQLASSASGSDYLLFSNHSATQLWLSTGGYSAADAAAVYTGARCASGSGSSCVATQPVYLSWDTALKIFTASSSCGETCPAITADALAETGDTVVAGVTTSYISGGGLDGIGGGSPSITTTLLTTTNGGDTVTTLGSVAGTIAGLTADSETVLVSALNSGSLDVYGFSLTGGLVGDHALAGSNIQNSSAAWVPTTAGMDAVIAASNPTTGAVSVWVSTNGGASFGSATIVATLNTTSTSAVLDQVGDTMLYPAGGTVGQVAATAVGGSLFVLYTNRVQGRVVAEDVVSPNGGTNWAGPYVAFPPAGSIQDPAVVPEPDGDILATWEDNGNGSWEVDQAVYSANGTLLQPVAALPGSGGDAATAYSAGAPAVSVDWLGRPLFAWTDPASSGGPAIEYSGDFLSASRSLAQLDHLLTDPLVTADFSPADSSSEETFNTSTSSAVTATSTDLEGGTDAALEAAQNETLKTTVPAATHIVLTTPYGSSSASNSTLSSALGIASPNVYLAVAAAQLLNALGLAVTSSPLSLVPSLSAVDDWTPVNTVSTGGTVDSEGWSVSVTPTPLNPADSELSTTPNYPEYTNVEDEQCLYDGTHKGGVSWTYYSVPVHWWSNISVNGGGTTSFPSTSAQPSVYLTNLTPYTNYSWSGTFAASYVEYLHEYSDACDINSTSVFWPDTLGPRSISGSLSGWTVSTLGVDVTPTTPSNAKFLNVQYTDGGAEATLVAYWNNTMLAADTIWLNETGGASNSWPNSEYAISEVSQPFNDLPNGSYTATVVARSATGTYSSAYRPAISFSDTYSEPAQTATASCSFTLAPPGIRLSTPTASQVSTSTEEIQWTANESGLGEVAYYEYGTGLNFTVTGIPGLADGSEWNYSVVLHGLDDFAVYRYSVGVGVASGCIEKSMWSSQYLFDTPSVLTLTDWSDPYDSITESGGGESILWQMPTSLSQRAEFQDGVLFWQNSSATVELPLTNTSEFESSQSPGYGIINDLSLPTMNTSYAVWVDLNYTSGGQPLDVTSVPVYFDYLPDSTGDGLTNLEKGLGWTVAYTNVTGASKTELAYANPAEYATNGLVGDYVEKEYDLNPNSVDTAGSGMLDTWNLTFADPGYELPTTSDLEIWDEQGFYDPYASGLEYSHDLYESGSPVDPNSPYLSNVTATAAGGRYSGDGSPWAAEVLWSYSALETFSNLSAVRDSGWLRAIQGKWDGVDTLTVEGKLSWGADPLATSTPDDGIADGERVNPLYDVGLEFGSVYANLSGEPGQTGYAVRMFDNYTNDAGRAIHVDNWSTEAIVDNATNATVKDYNTTLPVTQTQENQTISLEVSKDLSDWPQPAHLDSSNELEVNVTYNLLEAAPAVIDLPGGGNGGTSTLYGVLQEVPMGVKAPTWLWLPTDNSTVNGLPVGLERYTGEQSFDLVVVSASTSISSGSVPLPWGGNSSGITLSPGLNAFLIPREQFLDSPFGQAIFLGRNTSYNASRGTPPLITTSGESALAPFGGSNLMIDLGAYWQNRAIEPGSTGNITPSTEGGTAAGSVLAVEVLAASTATGNNTGGLPSNPNLYTDAGGDPSAVQSIVTLNVTNTSTLDLLLAGLMDNTTGGWDAVNGTFQSVTDEVGFLGLGTATTRALPNATEPSDGLWGPPTSEAQSKPTSSLFGEFWNAVTSFVTNPLGTVLSLAYTVWDAAEAASTYFDHLVHEATALGAEVEIRTATALKSIGTVVLQILNAILQYLLRLAAETLTAIIGPFASFFRAGIADWMSAWVGVSNSIDNFYLSTGSARAQYQASAVAHMSSELTPTILVMAGFTTGVLIATTILGPLDVVGGLVASLIISVMSTAFAASLGSGALGTPQDSLLGAGLSGFGVVSSVSESIFNRTEEPLPLNSSAAMSIAVPDGDPWDAVGTVAGLVGGLVVLYAAAADLSNTPGSALPSVGVACLMAFLGIGLAFDAAALLTQLPAPGNSNSTRQSYQADSDLALISAVAGITGLIASAIAFARGAGLISTVVALVVSAVVAGTGFAVIVHNHSVEGTWP